MLIYKNANNSIRLGAFRISEARRAKARCSHAGFTIIELLVVIAIIGILASTVVVTSLKGMAQSRDARRIQELYQIVHGLQLYWATYERYPDGNDDNDTGCDIHGVRWDAGNALVNGADDPFVQPLLAEGFLNIAPKEWLNIIDPNGSQCIYRYARVENPCGCDGWYAILYGVCESPYCPTGERPTCCDGSSWTEGTGANDPYDIAIFLKER